MATFEVSETVGDQGWYGLVGGNGEQQLEASSSSLQRLPRAAARATGSGAAVSIPQLLG